VASDFVFSGSDWDGKWIGSTTRRIVGEHVFASKEGPGSVSIDAFFDVAGDFVRRADWLCRNAAKRTGRGGTAVPDARSVFEDPTYLRGAPDGQFRYGGALRVYRYVNVRTYCGFRVQDAHIRVPARLGYNL